MEFFYSLFSFSEESFKLLKSNPYATSYKVIK